jgi:hypothetical protein
MLPLPAARDESPVGRISRRRPLRSGIAIGGVVNLDALRSHKGLTTLKASDWRVGSLDALKALPRLTTLTLTIFDSKLIDFSSTESAGRLETLSITHQFHDPTRRAAEIASAARSVRGCQGTPARR